MCWQSLTASEVSLGEAFLPYSSFWLLLALASLACGCITPAPASVFTSPVCLSNPLLFVHFISRAFILGFWTHLHHPGLSPISRSLVISAKLFFLNNLTFMGSEV